MNEHERNVSNDLLTTYNSLLKSSDFKEETNKVEKFNSFVEAEIEKITKVICDENILEIPGLITYDSLYKYRVHMGIITDQKYNPEYRGFLNIKYTLIRKLIVNGQKEYLKSQIPVDLEMPVEELYLSRKADLLLKRSIILNSNEKIKLKHIISTYNSLSSDNRKFIFGKMEGKEIIGIIVACGHGNEIGVGEETLKQKYLRLLNELSVAKNAYNKKLEEYKLVKQQLDEENKKMK